ncbi:porin [Oleispirillum naphthae]|uniref:porin n=1 Tax=Oleispirillum naphthae TaxID=2838853 RepID=UPI0030822D7F
MKKILFGTSALLAASALASAAQASDPIKLKLGGFMEYYMAGASQDGDFKKGTAVNNFDVQGESEIWFVGSTTLDNGMKISVQVELEAGSDGDASGGDNIDESYMTIEGNYGKLIVGSEDNAAYLMRAAAPNAAYTEVDDVAIPRYLSRPAAVTDNITDLGFDGDANKLSYFTPKFYGVQAGASYAPSNNTVGDDASAVSETVTRAADFDEAMALTLSYDNTFGPVGVLATAGYTMANGRHDAAAGTKSSKDASDWAVGLNLTYGGFTLGGAYRGINAPESTASASADGFAWDAGLMYAEGPYAVSLNYRKSSAEGATNNKGKDIIDTYAVGAKYALGAGVDLFGQVAYADYKDGDSVTPANSNDGAYGGVVGIHLDF